MKKYFLVLICFAAPDLVAQDSTKAARWNFSAWAEVFVLPGDEAYFNPTFYARTNTMHLEGRYNYEDRNTISLWAGRRFTFGSDVAFVVVPMAGVVFGNSDGLAPGLEAEATYRKFDFYVEMEYLFEFNSKENNFFYMYSELALRPIRPIRTGLIAQRTKIFESELEVQRGLFAEYYFGKFRAGVFYFNPFSSDNFWIASVSFDF